MGFLPGNNDSETGGFGFTRSNANNGLAGRADPVNPNDEAVPGGAGGVGVFGFTKVRKAAGVFGVNDTDEGVGVQGNGPEAGVAGFNNKGTGPGVKGFSEGNTGVLGQSTTGSGIVATSRDGQGVSTFSDNDIAIFAKGGKFAGVFDGNVDVSKDLTVAGDIILRNADCAEYFDISVLEATEPGTVMVLTEEGELMPGSEAYDKKVAGVISGAGSYKPGIVLDKQDLQDHRLPIALLGKVYCKVDACYGSINVGDLLTTSPTPGHAMKAQDPLKALGAIIGKSLRHIVSGRGLIPILVALQ